MYDALKALRPDWHAKEETKGGMKVVMTGSASDPADIQRTSVPKFKTKQLPTGSRTKTTRKQKTY